ncbi:Cytidylate kinase [hydrothermal vent metagenome]|uniref:(d)CMP kinase n=1 Tax=hydrothermal vent metagenome TaxID=652676 RepID=A0A3B1CP31_9ZZZZ
MSTLLGYHFKKPLVITIDGPAGAGKSTTARALASVLSYLYLDTGALYRAMTWKIIQEKIDPDNLSEIASFCEDIDLSLTVTGKKTEVWVDGVNVTAFLRDPAVTKLSSRISALAPVRKKLLVIQQQVGEKGGIVAEGRDIGRVVFPDADLKFYFDADANVRGMRRCKDLKKQGIKTNISSTTQALKTRDFKDTSRKLSPLKKDDDAIVLDTTDLNPDEVLQAILKEVVRVGVSCPD